MDLYQISTKKNVHIRDRCEYFFSLMNDYQRKYQRENSLTDLHESILKNSIENLEQSLSNGVPIDLDDHAGQTPLFYASKLGYKSIVELLLSKGASHKIIDQNGISPLHTAACKGHDEVVLILLKNGADPNVRAHDETSALYQSSYEGHAECVDHLTEYGARVNDAKNSGASPLFVAARNGHHRIVQRLLQFGANPSQTQRDLRSPLHTALIYNQRKCAELLLQHENFSDQLLKQSDIYGWNCLHFLSKKGSIQSAEFFFNYLQTNEKSFDLNQKDKFGNTALHIAIFHDHIEFAEYLIDKGLNRNEENSSGWTYDTYLMKSKEKSRSIDSSCPKEYLICLLSEHMICSTSEIELMRFEVENYVRELVSYVAKFDSLFVNCVIPSGSYYEGTRVGSPSEFDYMINLIEIERLTTFIENDFDPSGFARLYPNDDPQSRQRLALYIEPTTGAISSEKLREKFFQFLTSARAHVINKEISSQFRHLKFEWTSNNKRCGTKIHALWYGKQYPSLTIEIDVVPCLTIHSWPKCAKFNWPFPNENPQFQLIPRSPNSNEKYLWRISTSKAELYHFHSLSPEQTRAYKILKTIRMLTTYNCQFEKTSYTAEELITSYMFKNEFLREIERCSHSSQWKDGSLIHRVLSILKRLHKQLSIGFISSFYIKDYNVIDLEDYLKVRQHQLKYLRLLQLNLQMKLQTNRRFIRSNTESKTISKRQFIRQRAITLHD